MGALHFNGHHFIHHMGKAGAFGAAQQQLACLQVVIGIQQQIHHALGGNIAHVIRLLRRRNTGKILLSLSVVGHDILILLAHQRFKQGFLAAVIPI